MAINFSIKSVHSNKHVKVARCQLLIVDVNCGYPNPCIHSSSLHCISDSLFFLPII